MTLGLQMREISAQTHDCVFENHLFSTVLSYRTENTRNIHKEHSQVTLLGKQFPILVDGHFSLAVKPVKLKACLATTLSGALSKLPSWKPASVYCLVSKTSTGFVPCAWYSHPYNTTAKMGECTCKIGGYVMQSGFSKSC